MTQFSSNESVSLERTINSLKSPTQTHPEDIDKIYELEKCTKWITENNYKKVCLQFPDYLLPDSCEISSRLQKKLGQVIYIIGDSAYESCCVDYVTAQHVESDAIIHFGSRCFSKWTGTIPCLCIYDKEIVDKSSFEELFFKKFGDKENVSIILDTPYIHIQEEITKCFEKYANVTVCNVDEFCFKQDYTILYVGQNNRKLLNFHLKCRVTSLYYYDPEEKEPILKYEENNIILKRRRFLIEKIKDSQTVGIIIGTVVIKNFINSINRIKKLLKLHNKTYYILSVGRPTVAKLANFPEMDVYILICCSMSDIFENREFYKPIVAPYDVEIALNPNANINFSYDVDLDNLDEEINEDAINKPDISLLSGNVRYNENLAEESAIIKDLVVKDNGTVAVSNNAGAGFLATRSFKGLEQNLGETEVKLATEGRKGIPQQYENEIF